jgi:hypothetical protein
MRVSALPDLSVRSAAAIGAAALLILGTAVTGLVTVGGSATGATGASVPGYPPTLHGRVLQHIQDAGFDIAVRDAANPRTIYVIVPRDEARAACNLIQPVARVVSQTRGAVRISVAGYEYLPAPDQDGHVGFTCYLGRSIGLPVRLQGPLGRRQVLSAPHLLHSGTAPSATVLDARDFPKPRHLPAGYRAVAAHPIDARQGRVVAERHYANGSAQLVVSSGALADLEPATGRKAARVTVAGHRATLLTDDGLRCVLWQIPGRNARSVCSRAAVPLRTAELLRIARSLR